MHCRSSSCAISILFIASCIATVGCVGEATTSSSSNICIGTDPIPLAVLTSVASIGIPSITPAFTIAGATTCLMAPLSSFLMPTKLVVAGCTVDTHTITLVLTSSSTKSAAISTSPTSACICLLFKCAITHRLHIWRDVSRTSWSSLITTLPHMESSHSGIHACIVTEYIGTSTTFVTFIHSAGAYTLMTGSECAWPCTCMLSYCFSIRTVSLTGSSTSDAGIELPAHCPIFAQSAPF